MEAALLLLLCWGLASASAQEDEDMMNNKVSLPSPPTSPSLTDGKTISVRETEI